MRYTVRKLGPGDARLLEGMSAAFAEAFNEPDTYLGAMPSRRYLEDLIAKPHIIAIVALAGQDVVGGLFAYELEKFEQQRREIYIYDLAVHAKHRRRGVATRLIAELQQIASRRGAYVIFVQADPGDTAAIRLYESLGEREDVLHFDISVR